jgi:hypothetical protein
MRSDDPMPAPYVAARRSAIDAILAADLAVKQLRAAGVRDDGFRAELTARCEAVTATMDDLARRAKEARASVTCNHDAPVSESSATRIARATQARETT